MESFELEVFGLVESLWFGRKLGWEFAAAVWKIGDRSIVSLATVSSSHGGFGLLNFVCMHNE